MLSLVGIQEIQTLLHTKIPFDDCQRRLYGGSGFPPIEMQRR